MQFDKAIVDRALGPRSVAVIGASDRSPFSVRLLDNLLGNRFDGDIVLVNPRRTEAFGRPCYPSLSEAPPVDVAVITLPREAVEAAVHECIATGCAGVVILAVGFRDSGEPEWRETEERIAGALRDAGRIMIGPNGLGAVFAPSRCAVIGAPVWWDLEPGGIAIAMQSGALLHSAMINLHGLGARVGYAISSGNGTGVSLGEWARVFADRDDVSVIGLLVEELGGDWAEFAAAAEAAQAAGKRLVVLKMGRTALGRAVALSHTGALAGEHAVFSDALRQVGALEADTFGEFVSVLALVDRFGQPTAKGVAIMSPTGGTNGLLADLCEVKGVEVAAPSAATEAAIRALPDFSGLVNPLDLNARWSFDLDATSRGVELLVGDDSVGAAVFGVPLLPDEHFEPMFVVLDRLAAIADAAGVPLVLTEAGYGKVDDSLAAFLAAQPGAIRIPNVHDALGAFRLWTAGLPDAAGAPAAATSHEPAGAIQWSDEHGLKSVLAERAGVDGVRFPASRFHPAPWAGVGAFGDGPWFAKVLGPTILHKSAMGLMRGPLRTGDDVARAAVELALVASAGGHEVSGLLVEQGAPDGFDLIVGISRQPMGWSVLVGAGGVDVERTARVRFAMLPVAPAYLGTLIAEMLGVAADAVAESVVAAVARLVGDLAGLAEHHGLASVECNPVRLTADGEAWVLDALALGGAR